MVMLAIGAVPRDGEAKLKRSTGRPVLLVDGADTLTLVPTQTLPTLGAGCDPYAQTAEAKPQGGRSKLDEMRALNNRMRKREPSQ